MHNILQWNISSYRQQFSELKWLLHKHAPSVVCLQETRISDRRAYPPSQYDIISSIHDPNDGHNRGVAILIRRIVPYQHIQLDTPLQALAVRVRLDKLYTICTLYLPHINVTKQQLLSLFDQLPLPFLLLGDFNAHSNLWGDVNNVLPNERGRIVEEILLERPVSLLNDGTPTHFNKATGTTSIIDLSFCSSNCIIDFQYSVVDSLHSSDHYPIMISSLARTALERPAQYNVKKADWGLFESLTETNIHMEDFPDIDSAMDNLTRIILAAADQSIPKKTTTYKNPPIPFWNDELEGLRRTRRKLERRYYNNRTPLNRTSFNRAQALFKYKLNQARKDSWKQFLSSINQHTTLHDIWTKVQKIMGKFKPFPHPVLLDLNNNLLTDRREVANLLASTFAQVASDTSYSRTFLRHKHSIESRPINFDTNNNYDYNIPFTDIEFQSALKSLSESAPGHDMITYSMLKHSHPSLKAAFLSTYNILYNTCTFPSSWNLAIILAFLKPQKESMDPKNYRPISLTLCICKLFERMINTRLVWFLENNGFVTVQQCGFRANRSTTDNLVFIDKYITEALASRQHFIGVFFDLKKAYDTAWRRGILEKLHDFGLRGNLPCFLKNFLSNRRIQVRVGNMLSDEYVLQEGIPQGSVLSCTLFMIAINDICSQLPRTIQSTLYVDDFAIFASGAQPNTIQRQLQLAIRQLERWSYRTGFTFSPEKSVSLHICRKHHCPKIAPHLTLYNTPIPNNESVKYLGVLIDNSYTWKPHITHLRRECMKILDVFKHLTTHSWGADRKSLLRLYTMLLKPKLEYGSEVYTSAAPSTLSKLDTIPNTAIRIATGAFKSSPIASLHTDSGILPIQYCRELKHLTYFMRLCVNDSHPMHLADADVDDDIHERCSLGRASSYLQKYQMQDITIQIESQLSVPPWTINNIHQCNHMRQFKKSDYTSAQLANLFNEHINSHSRSMHIFTDGSKTDNGTACAIIAPNSTQQLRLPAICSNYTAELMAIKTAVQYISENFQNMATTIYCDSSSAIDAVTAYNSTHPIVRSIVLLVSSCNQSFTFCWVPAHVGILQNEAVDNAARQAIDSEPITEMRIPRSDIRIHLKKRAKSLWYQSWSVLHPLNNKLRAIKDLPTPYIHVFFDDRYWERILCRLRIGHTVLTHQYLMEGDEQPLCLSCLVHLTVYHIIMECPDYSNERIQFGLANHSFQHIMTVLCDLHGPLYQFLRTIQSLNKF